MWRLRSSTIMQTMIGCFGAWRDAAASLLRPAAKAIQ